MGKEETRIQAIINVRPIANIDAPINAAEVDAAVENLQRDLEKRMENFSGEVQIVAEAMQVVQAETARSA